MLEPETQPDSGTGQELPADEAPATEEITDTPADASADGDSDGDSTPGGPDAAGSRVPYPRFYQVNEKRKALELENAELKERLKASEPKKPEVLLSPSAQLKRVLKPAPGDLSTLDQMEFYGLETLKAHAPEFMDRWFEEKFGMKPEAAAATLTHTTQTTREQIINKYETAAKARGLDPTNPQLRDAVGTLMDSGRYTSFEAAMDTFRPAQQAARPQAKPINGRGAEVESVDLDGLSRVRAMPRNAMEASKLAAQGKRIENASVKEILAAMQDKA